MRYLLLLLLVGCSHLFYQPSPQQYLDPAQFRLSYQDVHFTARDGTPLHGWFFPAQGEKVKGTVVQFHGNAQNISTHFLSLVWLVQHGYNLFIFDYRGYGKSPGKPSQERVHLDALAGLDQGHRLWEEKGRGRFIVYGQSLGSIISLRALEDWRGGEVDLIVQDSPFYSYKKIAFDKVAETWLLWPLSPFAFMLVSDDYASWQKISEIRAPLLVITSTQDRLTPPLYGKWIYNHVASERKWYWKSHEAGHIGIYFTQNEQWKGKLLELLDQL